MDDLADLVDREHSARPSNGRWHPRALMLALTVACIVAEACASPAGDAGSTGSTGSTSSTSETSAPTTSMTSTPTTGTATTSTTSGPECIEPADCPGLDDACYTRTCEDGQCGHIALESGKISLGGPPAVILPADPLDTDRYVVVATDLNGDDRSDFVVTGSTHLQTVSVLLGTGDGTFAARVDYPTRVAPGVLGCEDGLESSAVADLSGDGKPDVVIAGKCTVSVLRNNGDGSLEFTTRLDFSATDRLNSVAAADLDGDGKVDLAVASGPQMVSVLFNNGDGTFEPRVDYLLASSPRFVAVADMNGDGAPDLAVAHGTETVSLLLNDGDGGLVAPIGYITDKFPSSVAAVDLNGDGWPDLAVAGNETVSVLLNNGDGTLATRVDYTVVSGAPVVAAADLNGDGVPDLIRPGDGDGTYVLLNSGDGTFTTSVDREDYRPYAVAVAELNGDGKPDLAVTLRFADVMNVRIGKGDGTFVPFGADYPKEDGSSPSYAVVVAELNGDGKPDLAVTHQADQILSTLMSKGAGTFAAPVGYPSTLADPDLVFGALATADLNGDGAPDLTALANNANQFGQPSTVTVSLNNKDGTLAIPANYPTGGDGYTNITTLDLRGDGKLALAVANENDNTVSVLRNSGDGTFVAPVTFATGDMPRSVVAADFDGDGTSDLAVTSWQDQAVNVLLNDGDGGFAPRVDYPVAELGVGIAAGDLDGDGAPDLAVTQRQLEPVGIERIKVLLNNGDGTFALWVDYPMRGSADVVLTADLNGDGWPDLAASSLTAIGVSVRLNQGDGTFAAQTFYPKIYGGLGASADLDGDGRIDLVLGNERILFNTCL